MVRDKDHLALQLATAANMKTKVVFVQADYQLLEEYAKEHREYLALVASPNRSNEDDDRLAVVSIASGSLNEYLKARVLSGQNLGGDYLTRTKAGTSHSIENNLIARHIKDHEQEIIDRTITPEVETQILEAERAKIEWWNSYWGYYHKETNERIGTQAEDVNNYINKNAKKIIADYIKNHHAEIINGYIETHKVEIVDAYTQSIAEIDANTIVIADIENMSFGDGSAYGGLALGDADLSGSRFKGVEFRNADLTRLKLRDTDLRSVIFEDCTMLEADLRGADLRGSWIRYTDEIGDNGVQIQQVTKGLQLSFADPEMLRTEKILGGEFFSSRSYGEERIGAQIVLDPTYIRGSNLEPRVQYQASVNDLEKFIASGESSELFTFEDFVRKIHDNVPKNVYISLREEDLSARGLNLSGLNLSGVDFSKCKFDGVAMEGVILTGACLEQASLKNCNLKHARLHDINGALIDLSGANLESAELDRSYLEKAILSSDAGKANFTKASIKFVNFRGANAEKVIFVEARADFVNMEEVTAAYADMTKICMRGANLRKAVLDHSRLVEAHLEHSIVDGAVLVEADLTSAFAEDLSAIGVDLRRATLNKIQARDANFSDAFMEQVSAQEANFKGAILKGVLAKKADLKRAIIEDADARSADFEEAILESVQGENVDLRCAILKQAKAINANLRDALLKAVDARFIDLESAVLKKADLQFSNLKGAVLKEADLEKAKLQAVDMTKVDARGAKFDGSVIDDNTLLIGANLDQAKDADHLKDQKAKQEAERKWGVYLQRLGDYCGGIASAIGDAITNGVNLMMAMSKGAIIGAVIADVFALTCIAVAIPTAGTSLIIGSIAVSAVGGALVGASIQYNYATTRTFDSFMKIGNVVLGREADDSTARVIASQQTIDLVPTKFVGATNSYSAEPLISHDVDGYRSPTIIPHFVSPAMVSSSLHHHDMGKDKIGSMVGRLAGNEAISQSTQRLIK